MDVLFYNLIRKMVNEPENFKVEEHTSGAGFTLTYIQNNVFKRSWYVSHTRYGGSYFSRDFSHSQCVKLKEVCRHVRAMQLRSL